MSKFPRQSLVIFIIKGFQTIVFTIIKTKTLVRKPLMIKMTFKNGDGSFSFKIPKMFYSHLHHSQWLLAPKYAEEIWLKQVYLQEGLNLLNTGNTTLIYENKICSFCFTKNIHIGRVRERWQKCAHMHSFKWNLSVLFYWSWNLPFIIFKMPTKPLWSHIPPNTREHASCLACHPYNLHGTSTANQKRVFNSIFNKSV